MERCLAILVLAAGVLPGHAIAAGELTVLSAGAVEPGLRAVVSAFENRTGGVVKITFNNVPQVRTRINGGERFDLVIATPVVLDEFVKAGKVGNQRVALGRVGMGVAVRAGAARPDLSNGETLTRAMLAADSLVFSRGSSGIYFESLLRKLGLYEQVAVKIIRYDNGEGVFEHILGGKGNELSFGQITEIGLHRNRGLQLVGPLPPDLQNYTSYVAAPMTGTSNANAVAELVRDLGSPAGKKLFAAAGIE